MSARRGPKRVALLVPMPIELRPLVRRLGLRRAGSADPVLHEGRLGEIEIVAALTGIGPARAARVTEHVLAAAPVDHVVVVGIAGAIGPRVAVGDLVVPERVRDLATGAEYRPTPLGDFAPRGALVTNDGLLTDAESYARLDREGVVAIDMETAAVAAVCARRGCPWSVFRGLSDRADDGSIDAAIFGLSHPDGSPDLRKVARFVVRQPGRIPQLARLARDSTRATRVAADAAVRAIGLGPAPPLD